MPQGTRNESCGHIRKWTSVLWARVQLQDVRKSDQRLNSRMWDIAPRNGTLDSNAGRNVKRSADVWGNARHFCDCELNYIGCESSRSTTQGCEQKGHQHLLMSFFVSCVVEFEKAETQAFLALSARLFKSLTAKFEPSSSLNAFSYILTSVPTWSQISF